MIENNGKGRCLKDFVSSAHLKPEWMNVIATGLTVDSRDIQPGHCFVAFPGHCSDGRDFLPQAFASGACAALVEADGFDAGSDSDDIVIPVSHLSAQLGSISAKFFAEPSLALDVVAVTGTNGKTSVTQLIAQALRFLQKKPGLIGTLGNGLLDHLSETSNTTPDIINTNRILRAMVDQGATHVAMEASSHGLVQGRLNGLSIHTAVVTNISRDHLDYHGTMEEYINAKSQLLHHPELKNAIVNADDSAVLAMAEAMPSAVNVLSFSAMDASNASVTAKDVKFHEEGMDFRVVYNNESAPIASALIGAFNLSNILAAASALLVLGFQLNDICDALSKSSAVPGRMQRVSLKGQLSVVVDFAHTPDALEKAISAMREHCAAKIWCVFGCGGDRDIGKRPLMAEAVSRLADEVIITSDNPRNEKVRSIIAHMVKGIPSGNPFHIIEDRAEAVRFAVKNAKRGDVVLLAGKGHEDYQEVMGVKHQYSDLQVARQALAERSAQGGAI